MKQGVFALLLLLVSCSLPSTAQTRKYWVWFADKGPGISAQGVLKKGSREFVEAASAMDVRALARRSKVRSSDALIDAADLSLYQPYLSSVAALGGIPARTSRWLNAASFLLTPAQADAVTKLPGVTGVTPVVIHHGVRTVAKSTPEQSLPFSAHKFEYGPSGVQDSAINIIQLHDLGITGSGVLIGMLDSGFRWRTHESLEFRDVLAEYDFVEGDSSVASDDRDTFYEDEHGTLTFSIVGGYMPGQLIGPAFNARFILGKTEYDDRSTDYYWEEDNWVAGMEWMERYGVDLVSCSLGYDEFQDTTSYTWANGDFNGRTTVTARAAIRAARLGVLLCTAMGNSGNGDGISGTMLTPADADSIVSVGAYLLTGRLAAFSSTGPTNDGRTKPDVVAPGASVWSADRSGHSTYFRQQGTSVATPLTTGVAALMLSARPELTAQQIIQTLHATADRNIVDSRFPVYPNNFAGWGSVNGLNAALSFGPIFSNRPAMRSNGPFNDVSIKVMSKFGINPDSVFFYYAFGADTNYASLAMTLDSSMVFETSGRYTINLPSATHGTLLHFYVEARDSAGHVYRSPAPVSKSDWILEYGTTSVATSPAKPAQYQLRPNYPNPFNPSTNIPFSTPVPVGTELTIHNMLGQLVRTLYKGASVGGDNFVRWDGNDDAGNPVPSGVYICRMKTAYATSSIKMMLVR